MGTLYNATCRCGYQKPFMQIGSGWARVEYQLLQCTQCHYLTVSNTVTQAKRCSTCRSRKVEVINPHSQPVLTCPLCGRPDLCLEDGGLWD